VTNTCADNNFASQFSYDFKKIREIEMAKIIQLEEKTEVDYETGEVVKLTNSRVISLPQEPPYVKMYIEDLGKLLDVPPGPRMVLYHLAKRIDYDGFISLTPTSRERVAIACEINVRTMNNYLTHLSKSGILKHIGRGEYEMSPHLFAKGDWKDISRRRTNFEMTVRYENGKRIIKGKSLSELPNKNNLDLFSTSEND